MKNAHQFAAPSRTRGTQELMTVPYLPSPDDERVTHWEAPTWPGARNVPYDRQAGSGFADVESIRNLRPLGLKLLNTRLLHEWVGNNVVCYFKVLRVWL
jgi:hypothetical protein